MTGMKEFSGLHQSVAVIVQNTSLTYPFGKKAGGFNIASAGKLLLW